MLRLTERIIIYGMIIPKAKSVQLQSIFAKNMSFHNWFNSSQEAQTVCI